MVNMLVYVEDLWVKGFVECIEIDEEIGVKPTAVRRDLDDRNKHTKEKMKETRYTKKKVSDIYKDLPNKDDGEV